MRKTAMNGTGTVIGLGLLFLAANTAPANAQGGNAPRVADAFSVIVERGTVWILQSIFVG